MSLGLLLPAGLLALAALLLPLLLHLDRQSQSRPTDFAALRWLSARLRPRRRLRLREWWLLLLRLLLVACVALLFARPAWFGGDGGRTWALVAPGADLVQARRQLPLPSARWHWLAPGFPAIDADPAKATAPPDAQPLASLLRQIDARLPAKSPIVVFVPERIGGLDGERPRLSRRIDWRIVGAARAGAASVPSTRFAPAPRLVVRHAGNQRAALPFLRASAIAWSVGEATRASSLATAAAVLDIADIAQPLPANTRWLAWLAPGPLPPAIRAWVEAGGTALLDAQVVLPVGIAPIPAWSDDNGVVIASSAVLGRGRLIVLARPLQPAALPVLLDPQFPSRLRELFEGPLAAPGMARAEALKPLPGGAVFPETPAPLDPWLVVAAAFLFALERWFASAARRGSAA